MTDILVGDVWLCSGQSNMEWPLSASVGGAAAVQGSADDGLRLLLIPKDTAAAPQAAFATPVAWAARLAESAPPVSAACYYMARQLRKDLGVPIGAINSFWGGSQIRAWLSPEAGARLYGTDQMALLAAFTADPLRAVTEFAPLWEEWWRKGSGGQEPWKNPRRARMAAGPLDHPRPGWTGTRLATDTIGNVWFRRTLTLTCEQRRQGRHAGDRRDRRHGHDLDQRQDRRQHLRLEHRTRVPDPARLPPRRRQRDRLRGEQQLWPRRLSRAPPTSSLSPLPAASASRSARAGAMIGAIREMPPRAPWDANAGIGVMHNKMIAPLGAFA